MNRAKQWEAEAFKMRLDDIYNTLNNNINWLTKRSGFMQRELAMLREKNERRQKESTSIDTETSPSIDARLTSLEDLVKSFDYNLDGVYYSRNDDMDGLTSRLILLQQEEISKSIDGTINSSIDANNPPAPTSYTRAETVQIIEEIYRTLGTDEDRLDRRCDDIYFPFNNSISGFNSQTERKQKEIRVTQRQLASHPEASA